MDTLINWIDKFTKGLCLTIMILITAVFATGCNTNRQDSANIEGVVTDTVLAKLDARQLVERYYKSLASKDWVTAKACLGDDYAEKSITYKDSYFHNLITLTDLKVSKEAPVKPRKAYFKEVQIVVEYNATYKRIQGSQDGAQISFVYIGKKNIDSPWKIISIGSGP